jgi:uncharacterized membrane protein
MRTRRNLTIIAHILASIATGFVSVAVGMLVSSAIDPTNAISRTVPVLIGALVAVGGGLFAARLVPWLVAGGLRSTVLPTSQRGGNSANHRSTASQQQ